MKILVDTREQYPLSFKHKLVSEVKVCGLKCGDYGCEMDDGKISLVCFERKSIADLFGTLTQGYERFKREMERAQQRGLRLIIIIEGTLSHTLYGHEFSQRDPHSLLQQIFTIMVKYNIGFVFCANREEASRYILEYFLAVNRWKDLPECCLAVEGKSLLITPKKRKEAHV